MFATRAVFGGMVALGLAAASSPSAANPFLIEPEAPAFTSTFAMRYWYGLGSVSKDLYGLSRDTLNSRLTYSGLQSHSLEIFTRVDHISGLFWKGYAGGGLLQLKVTCRMRTSRPAFPLIPARTVSFKSSLGYISVDFGGALVHGSISVSMRLSAITICTPARRPSVASRPRLIP